MGAPLFLGYWLYSFHSRILPNWIVAAVAADVLSDGRLLE